MLLKTKETRIIFYLAVLAAGVLPLILYWIFIGRAPNINPKEAVEILDKLDSSAVLVDIRTPQEFKDNRLDDAQNWPYTNIMKLSSRMAIPEKFAGKYLLLICKSGIKSALAARRLQELQVTNVTSVRGGMQAWVANAEIPYGLEFYKIRKKSGEIKSNTYRETPLFQQWIIVIYGYAIKYTYMILSLVLVLILWRSKSLDLKALKWGLAFFFIGESFCAANSFIYRGSSYLFEYFHSFGMVLSFGFVTFAILEGMDYRIIKVTNTEQKCAALGLCRSCIKYTEAPCGLKRLFLFLTPACIAISFIPLTAIPHWTSYNTHVFGVYLNFSHPVINQLFEFRFCPIIAIVLFVPAFMILLLSKKDPITPSKVLFAGGMGYIGFGLFRLFLLTPYWDNLVWKSFWEELTELIFVVGVGVTLWIFRNKLFSKKDI